MDSAERIEAALERAMRHCESPSTPPSLCAAMRHAVFPGGARLRPGLCLSVAAACGAKAPAVSGSDPAADPHADVAASLELLHCASLVHDDLPCFDDASLRRGRPSVHARFGEELAVLAGDGLIILGFELVAEAELDPVLVTRLLRFVTRGVGARGGLVAGQAWESEPSVRLQTYHKAKTAALFQAGARAGALLAGTSADAWATFGMRLGEAYQVADDLRDMLDDAADLGKPVGQDMVHDRPNACLALGIDGALARLRQLIDQSVEAMPACPHPERVIEWVDRFAARLYPSHARTARPLASANGAANGTATAPANSTLIADLRV